ncbi:MAG TPA: DUF4350 domain-containing protein [Acidimicrobiia bacterium]|nr:DUF4350 domain-containing protein [Acidimicrobiia bacterium]
MIPPSTTITDQGRRIRRILIWLAAAVLALNVVVWVVSRFATDGGVSGPDGSSFVTTEMGSAATAGMLERLGYQVSRLRVPLDEAGLDPAGSLVIVDVGESEYSTSELNAVDRFLRDGGRVLVAGQAAMVERLIDHPPEWQSDGASHAEMVGDVTGQASGSTVTLSGFGALEISGVDAPFLTAPDGTVVGSYRAVGQGVFLWLADSQPLHNDGIGRSGSAVAAVGMIDPVTTVAFDEFRHGFIEGGGILAAIPPRVKVALFLGGVVTLLALIAYGRRFGPPYDIVRRLPPGREAYLDAVAGMMARSGETAEALAVIREEGRLRLRQRSEESDHSAVAGSAGLDEEAIDALLGNDDSDEALVAADRALAALYREKE